MGRTHTRSGLMVGLIWILGSLSLSTPAGAGEPVYSDLVGQAVAARKAGDLAGAAAALQKALEQNPSPELSNNLARVYEEMGQYIKAYDIYLQVSNDPLADRSLRALDSGRMAALQPKIGVAWLVPKIAPEGASISLDGRVLEGRALTMEQATGPGRSGLELISPGASEVVVRVMKFPVGERSTYEEDLTERPASDATLSFAGVLPVGEVRLNGHRIKTDLGTIATCRVTSGPMILDIRRPGMKKEVHKLDLGEGDEVAIVDILRNDPLPAAGVVVEPWSPSLGPWVVGGAGGVAAVTGVGFLTSAGASQQELEDHMDGTAFVGISHLRAKELDDRANSHGTVGNALLSVGLSALVGGAVWYLIDQLSAPDDDEPIVAEVMP